MKADIGKVAAKGKQTTKVNFSIISNILLVVLSLFLIISPFYRGLYFRENYLPAIVLISSMFIVLMVQYLQNKKSVIESYMDISILVLLAAYSISFIFGISKMDSLDGLLKYAAAFMFYKAAYELAKDKINRSIMINLFILSGFIMALISMLGSADIIKIKGIFGWGDRLNGPYQYPNSTASVLGAIFILNLITLLSYKNRNIKAAYIFSAATIFLAFMETRSRGGMLTFAVAWLLALVLLKGRDKLKLIMYSLVPVVLSLLMYDKVYTTFINKNGFFTVYIIFAAIAVISGFALSFIEKFVDQVSEKFINKSLLIIIAVCAVILIAAFNITAPLELSEMNRAGEYQIYNVKPNTVYTVDIVAESSDGTTANLAVAVSSVDSAKVRTNILNTQIAVDGKRADTMELTTLENTSFIVLNFENAAPQNRLQVHSFILKDRSNGNIVEDLKLKYRFIPDDIAKKVNEISLKTESSSERIVFVKDGLKMFKDYAVFGTGANGWGTLYTKYQSYPYVSREAHNYYLQTAIESGVLGIASVVLVIVGLTCTCFKIYKKNDQNRNVIIGLFAMIFALFAHAMIDFDFSLYSILLLLFASIGCISGLSYEYDIMTIKGKPRRVSAYIAMLMGIVILLLSFLTYSGLMDGDKGVQASKTDMIKAKEYYKKAMNKDFYNPTHIVNYGQLVNLDVENSKEKDKDQLEQIYNSYKKLEKIDHYKVKYYMVLLNFYLRYGYLEDADRLIDTAIELQPLMPKHYETKASLNSNIMDVYIQNKNTQKALEYCNNIIEIEQQHANANKNTITPFELTENTKKLIEEAKIIKPQLE